MEYRKMGDTWTVRLERGEEVLACLTELCARENIALGTVTAIGAADEATLGLYDVPTQTYHSQTFAMPMEICSLTGNVTRKDGAVYLHLHAALCDPQLRVWGGHVNRLRISATCELFVRELPGAVGRRQDPAVGLNVFDFEGESR